MATIDTLVQGWSEWLAATSWQITAFVVVVALLAACARRLSARVRYVLWLLVLVKAFMPPSLEAPWSAAQSVGEPLARWVVRNSAQDVPTGETYVGRMGAAAQEMSGLSGSAISEEGEGVAGGGRSAKLAAVWLAGVLAFGGFVLARYMRVTRSLHAAPVVDEGPLRVMMEQLALRLGTTRTPDLILSEHVTSPFLFGLLRPRIVLPAKLPYMLSREELENVILHELVHDKRRDVLVGWIQVLAQGLFWFHPLVWYANAQIRHEREGACDETVLLTGCAAAKHYGESLLRVLLVARGRSSAAMGFLGIFERNTRLRKRLENIMSTGHRRVALWNWVFVASIALFFVPMSCSREAKPSEKTPMGVAKPTTPENTEPAKVPIAQPQSALRYIVSFEERPPFHFEIASELFAAFTEYYPQAVQIHDFRTRVETGKLVGLVCVEREHGKDAIVEMLRNSPKIRLKDCAEASEKSLLELKAMGQPSLGAERPAHNAAPPRVVSTSPAVGAKEVDPALKEISVTFDRDMDMRGYSWTGGGEYYPPAPQGCKPAWRDARTCVLPVKLEAGHYYRVGINSSSYQNFCGADGAPVDPIAIYFTTRGAGPETKARVRAPRVIEMIPANNAKEVDPALRELRVTFDMPMGSGFSWCGGGPTYPESAEGTRARWSQDRRTCILPVRLKPGHGYALSLNAQSFVNFESEAGVPLEPVEWQFSTK